MAVDIAIDIRRAQSIYGWMQPGELQWLAEQAREHLLIVEIGSYLGRSTRALADNTLGKVLAVDDWQGADSDHRPVSFERQQQLYTEFCGNMGELIKAGIVIPCRVDHGSVQIKINPDMVFIDGDHTYEGARRDIQIWYPQLKPGGLISGHDSGHPPIRQALAELLPNYQLVRDTTIWHYTKPRLSEGAW